MTSKPDPLAPGHITGQNPATPERLPGHTADVGSESNGGNEEELGGRPAFVFEAGEMVGVTLDSSGSNLPPQHSGPWVLAHYVTLGVRDVGMPGISPEPVIRGIRSKGYYVWRTTDPSWGQGTSQ